MMRKLRDMLPYAIDLVKEHQRTQRSLVGKEFISIRDVGYCAAKYYVLRRTGTLEDAVNISNQIKGDAIRQSVVGMLTQLDPTNIPHTRYLGKIAFVGLGGGEVMGKEVTIAAEPDIVDKPQMPSSLTNIKMHQMTKGQMSFIMAEQHNFLEVMNSAGMVRQPTMPQIQHILKTQKPKLYDIFGSYYPAYISDLVELIACDQFASFSDQCQLLVKTGRKGASGSEKDPNVCDPPRKLTLRQVLRDGIFNIEIDRGDIYRLWPWFWEYLTSIAYAYIQSSTQGPVDQEVVDQLVIREVIDLNCTRYFQCETCVARSLGFCKGMPPLHAHRVRTDAFLNDFVNYWSRRTAIQPPPMPQEADPYINDQGQQVKGEFEKARWKDTVAWTKRVRYGLSKIARFPAMVITEIKLTGLE